ncbi:MAG TPA: NfeD family protein [Verrucomicrobiae bacterium]|nr:NfeD family protein [Verrucomicrobiae bacterium]
MLIAATVGPLGWAYLICLLLGLFYGIFAGLFSLVGGHSGVHHGIEGAGHTADEVSQMGHEPGTIDSGVHMTPFNPVVIAIFLVSFGGTGLASMQLFNWHLVSLAVAAPSGFVLAAITFAIFERMFSATQGSSEPTQQEAIGKEAEVITPIPENGLGEIAYTRRGSRFTAAARSESGAAIPKHSVVTVTRVVGNMFHVKPTGGS